MIEHLMPKSDEQESLEAVDTILQAILDEKAQDLINWYGVKYVAKELRKGDKGRYRAAFGTIVPRDSE